MTFRRVVGVERSSSLSRIHGDFYPTTRLGRKHEIGLGPGSPNS
jgi:hypothetical protein